LSETWLLLDIGNTHTVAGLFGADGTAIEEVRFRTDPSCTADEYRVQLRQLFQEGLGTSVWSVADRAVVSTVVPALEPVIARACAEGARAIPFLSVNAGLARDFSLDLPIPEQLGADRLANAAGALTLVAPPLLIVDAGTATTFCLIDSRRAYIGGAIVPGLETSWKALQSRAAKLFSVELKRPHSTVGNTTETQIQSGVLCGYEALIEGMADRLLADSGLAGATLIATGGCTRLIRLSPRFRLEPDLTLLGLHRYGQLNG
jgi:type III pantothenate kinase